MPDEILLIISILAGIAGSVVKKSYINTFKGSNKKINFHNTVLSIFAVIVFFIWGGFGSASFFTILVGFCFGLMTALQHLFSSKAISVGSWAYTTIIIYLATLIPTCSGWIFWNEPFSWVQIVGIILLVVCFFLSTDLSTNESKLLSVKWLIYALMAFLAMGILSLLLKIHAKSVYAEERNAFLIVAFLVSFLYPAVLYFIELRKEKKQEPKNLESQDKGLKFTKNYYSWFWITLVAISGIFAALNNKFNLRLSGVFDSAFFFPVTSGANIILTALISVLVFKDKLKLKQWIGFGVGVVALIFLVNPFGL